MTKENTRTGSTKGGAETALDRILASDLGAPSPRSAYYRPLESEDCAALENELIDVERAHADAAVRLPSLYAG